MPERKPMKISADRNSPHWFHGITQFEPFLDGQRMNNVLFADEEEGVIEVLSEGKVDRLKGRVEIRPIGHLRLVGGGCL